MEVDIKRYVLAQKIKIRDSFTLYKRTDEKLQPFDIILQVKQTSFKAYKLMTTPCQETAQVMFKNFYEKLPLLLDSFQREDYENLLQMTVKTMSKYPTWTQAHVAAHCGFKECFKHKVIQSQINMCCEDSLMTPLHLAVKAEQIDCVICLIDLDVRLDITDVNGDTVFHYAATTTRDIIQVLCNKPVSTIINKRNKEGCTPFHLACKANKVECVAEFLKIGINVNMKFGSFEDTCTDSPSRCMKEVLDRYKNYFDESSIKFGGTPLHWSLTPELTEVLIEHGCNVNIRNFQGNTALHLMVKMNRYHCAVALLGCEADVNIQNAEGNTPLHLAVKNGNLPMVQVCISFGADVNSRNTQGETPRHLAALEKKQAYGEILYALHCVGAERCKMPIHSCSDGCKIHGQFNGMPSETSTSSKKTETG